MRAGLGDDMRKKRLLTMTVLTGLLAAVVPAVNAWMPACDQGSPVVLEKNKHCTPPPPPPTLRVLDGKVDDWTGASTLLGGTWLVSNSELVYQDHIYDDYGAAGGIGADQRATFAGKTDGTSRYPTDEQRFAHNAADLFQLRLSASGDFVWGLARFNTLRDPDTTVTSIAVDTDGDLTDTSGIWPRDAGVATPGADRVITIWADADGTGHGEVADLDSGTTTAFSGVAVDIDNDSNAFEFALPRALIGGTSWRLWSGTGLWDGDGYMEISSGAPTATTAGNGKSGMTNRLFNVAFRDNEIGHYFESRQSAALAADDITAFSVTFAPDGPAHIPYVVEPGRTYAPVVDEGFSVPPLHEGASYEGASGRATTGIDAYSQRFDTFGRWQPYALYLPAAWTPSRTWPTLVALHGRGGSHASYFEFGGGFQRDIGEGRPDDPMVIVSPLGRGRSHYESWGEADVLRVIDDAIARFSVDTDRISLAGYSMGGLGVYRLATMYPDRWATALTWAGASSEYTGVWATCYACLTGDPGGIAQKVNERTGAGGGRAIGNGNHMPTGDYVHVVGNLRHMPVLLQTGTNDEMLPLTGQVAPHVALDELDLRYRVDLYAGYGHLSWGAFDVWTTARDWIGTRTRMERPRQIDYKFSDSIADPATSAELGIKYGNAWWIRDLTRRDADPSDPEDPYLYGSVSAVSRAVPAAAHTVNRSSTPSNEQHPHMRFALDWSLGLPEATANALELTLTNLSAATVDLAEARLTPGGLRVSLTADGPGVVHLLGSFAGLPPVVVGDAFVTIDAAGAHVSVGNAGIVEVVFT